MTEPASGTGDRFDTHVCLISEQATPNLTPLLDAGFRPTRRVVMVCSAEMRQRQKWLEDLAKPRGLQVEVLEVRDAWDLVEVQTVLLDWLTAQDPEEAIALNVTGGTKPMAIAAQQVFAEAGGRPVFYLRQDRDEVLWLTPRGPARRLENRLKLEDYVHVHGWSIVARPDAQRRDRERMALAHDLALNVRSFARPLGALNWYASRCDQDKVLSIALKSGQLASHDFMSLLDKFAEVGACRRVGERLEFPDDAARFYCNGGWLEVHTAELLESLRAKCGIQDLASGLKVRTVDNRLHGNAATNELDVAVLARNRLHIVECKTRSFHDDGSAADAMYKLDTLSALGGLNTRTMLVSYRDLSDGERQRAKDLRIRTIVGDQIANLANAMQEWLGSAH